MLNSGMLGKIHAQGVAVNSQFLFVQIIYDNLPGNKFH